MITGHNKEAMLIPCYPESSQSLRYMCRILYILKLE